MVQIFDPLVKKVLRKEGDELQFMLDSKDKLTGELLKRLSENKELAEEYIENVCNFWRSMESLIEKAGLDNKDFKEFFDMNARVLRYAFGLEKLDNLKEVIQF